MFQLNWLELATAALPHLTVLLAAIVILLLSAFSRGPARGFFRALAVAGLASAYMVAWQMWPCAAINPHLQLQPDRTALVAFIIVIISAAFTAAMTPMRMFESAKKEGEYYALMLLACFGAGVLSSATEFVTMLIGIETMTFAIYALIGAFGGREAQAEAALKYFVMGMMAAAFFVMGIAFLFGSLGSTSIPVISEGARELSGAGGPIPFFLLGLAIILAGFCFKGAIVPFHAWAPDVYSGAPTPVTSFIATAVKAALFVAFVRFAVAVAGTAGVLWHHALFALSFVTMLYGNLCALSEDNLKRMLAYSAIAHAGSVLTVFPSISTEPSPAMQAVLFYLFAYAVMTSGAFACIAALEEERGDVKVGMLTGLASKRPFIASVFALFLISLAGFPPTVGFFAKYYIFLQAAKAGDIWLVVAGVANTALAVYYYLRPVAVMYFHARPAVAYSGDARAQATVSQAIVAVLVIAALAVLIFGIAPSNLLMMFHASTAGFAR